MTSVGFGGISLKSSERADVREPARAAKRILVVGARGVPNVEGGAEKNAEALFPRVVSRGYRVELMGLRDNITCAEYRGVVLRKAPRINILKTDKLGYYAYALLVAMRRRPDLVHFQGLGSALFLIFYKAMGCRTVVRYGSADYEVAKWGFLGRLGFRLAEFQLRFADAVISVAPSLSRRLAKRGIRNSVHLIPNALDAPKPLTGRCGAEAVLDDDAPFILAVCRVTPQKNLEALIAAFELFALQHPEYRLVIAGGLEETDYVEALKRMASDSVRFVGRVPRDAVPELLRKAAFFVNISHHEGSSNATLEAISQGCPVLLSDIPENRDMGLPDKHLIDRTDIPVIASTFETIARNPSSYVVDGEGFLSWEDVAEKTVEVYRRIGVAVD